MAGSEFEERCVVVILSAGVIQGFGGGDEGIADMWVSCPVPTELGVGLGAEVV